MTGIYFSGTGNTRYCVETLTALLDKKGKCFSIEDRDSLKALKEEEKIIIGYPIQFSAIPVFMKEYIKKNQDIWKDKKIFIVVTMGGFCGDGTGCSARMFKKYGAQILGGVQIIMPDSICDSIKMHKTDEQNLALIKKAEKRLLKIAESIKKGEYPCEGLSFMEQLTGLFAQRLWMSKRHYTVNSVKVSDECSGCEQCTKVCPMHNLQMKDGKAQALEKCTLCYRCANTCPKKAISILGKNVIDQVSFAKFTES